MLYFNMSLWPYFRVSALTNLFLYVSHLIFYQLLTLCNSSTFFSYSILISHIWIRSCQYQSWISINDHDQLVLLIGHHFNLNWRQLGVYPKSLSFAISIISNQSTFNLDHFQCSIINLFVNFDSFVISLCQYLSNQPFYQSLIDLSSISVSHQSLSIWIN